MSLVKVKRIALPSVVVAVGIVAAEASPTRFQSSSRSLIGFEDCRWKCLARLHRSFTPNFNRSSRWLLAWYPVAGVAAFRPHHNSVAVAISVDQFIAVLF